jgi:hypothetical protein
MNAADFTPVALHEAIERLAAMPAHLAAALGSAGPGRWTTQPAPEVFSLVEHACHLRDLEGEGYLVRVRRVLAEDRPALEGFDGAAVAATRHYLAQDASLAAAQFARARGELVALLAPLTPAELAREATFMGKPSCMADLVAMMVEHDRGHREEIDALLAGLGD